MSPNKKGLDLSAVAEQMKGCWKKNHFSYKENSFRAEEKYEHLYSLRESLREGSLANNKLLQQYKKYLEKLSQVQWEAALGLILGSASLQTQNNGKTFRMKFEWGDRSKIYIDHVFNLFDEWVLSEPHKKIRFSPAGNKVIN